MMTKRLRCWLQFWLACSVVAILCTSFGFGQTVTGAITGQVTDPSGAVVVGAHVTGENADTNQWVRDLHHPLSAHRHLYRHHRSQGVHHSEGSAVCFGDRPHS